MGLNGFVRNCGDGCVETEVEGEEDAVEKYRQWCKIGSPGAKVERIEEELAEVRGYDTFEIRDSKF